jgi:hypothetical protein
MADPLLTSYVEGPYKSKPVPGCHSDGLVTIAILHRM